MYLSWSTLLSMHLWSPLTMVNNSKSNEPAVKAPPQVSCPPRVLYEAHREFQETHGIRLLTAFGL